MTGFTKLFSSIVTSSVWSEPHHVVRLWITMLALADANGIVEGSVPGLARLANVTREECEDGLTRFLSPDADSRDLDLHPEREGRRIEKVPGGWRLLNHERYRETRGAVPSETPAARRARRYRERKGSADVTQRDERDAGVTGRDASASASASGSSEQELDQKQKPVRRELTNGAGLALDDGRVVHFGPCHGIVEGYARTLKMPEAFLASLRLHLDGEMSHEKATAEVLGLAVQQLAGLNESRFDARFFAGIVRGVKRRLVVGENRKRADQETATLATEKDAARLRAIEDAEGRLIAFASSLHRERFEELKEIADQQVPKKFQREMRELMVHGALVDLIRKEWPDAR